MPILFDIETIPQPQDILLAKLPPWDIEEAKTRLPKNYKNAEAINGWLEKDEANWTTSLLEKAALSPETGQIALAGFWKDGQYTPLMGDEKHLVFQILTITYEAIYNDGANVISWNGHNFDWPFTIKRAWVHGVNVRKSIFNPVSRYPLNDSIIDAMKVWQAGNFKAPFTSLNNALRACGLDGKGNGADFGKLWETDREAAIAYNRYELEQSAKLYERMGLL